MLLAGDSSNALSGGSSIVRSLADCGILKTVGAVALI